MLQVAYKVAVSTVIKYYYAGDVCIAMRTGETLAYLLGDHVGSTSVTVNSNGARQGEMWYKPWGEPRGVPYGTTPTDYRYTGQREESDLNLYWLGFRMYDPRLGRFI